MVDSQYCHRHAELDAGRAPHANANGSLAAEFADERPFEDAAPFPDVDLKTEAARWPRGRDISHAEIGTIVRAHHMWRESKGAAGKRADLSYCNLIMTDFGRLWLPYADLRGSRWMLSRMPHSVFSNTDLRSASMNATDLSGASLSESDLRGIYLRGVNLTGAYMQGADLRGAFLEGAVLESREKTDAEIRAEREELAQWDADADNETDASSESIEPRIKAADVTGARFRDADLSEALLTDVVGLRSDSLAGTVLTNAKLPPDIAKFELLGHVTEISKTASTTFLAMIAASTYCVLTLATTGVGTRGSVKLPIVGTAISVAGFFVVAPLVLVGLYLYLHMYLLRLWQALGSLPARFPDGRSLDEKAYPWLLTSLVQLYVPKLKANRPPLWWLQVAISILTAWVLVPAVVVAYVAVTVVANRWVSGVILVVIALGCIVIGSMTFNLARQHLTGSVSDGGQAATRHPTTS